MKPTIHYEQSIDYQYSQILDNILRDGQKVEERTGTGAQSLFFQNLSYKFNGVFDLDDRGSLHFEIPAILGKKLAMKPLIGELVWFLKGMTNNNELEAMNSTIWREWAKSDGDLGPIYGEQWRRMPIPEEYRTGKLAGKKTFDQIFDVATEIRNNPKSRRHIVVAYNPVAAHLQSLPACHAMMQWSVRPNNGYDLYDRTAFTSGKNTLDLIVYQRSADMFLGVPFNICSYGILQALMAFHTGTVPGRINFTFGDAHIYDNHVEQVKKYRDQFHELTYEEDVPLSVMSVDVGKSPESLFNEYVDGPQSDKCFTLDPSDFSILQYSPMPAIKAPVAV